MPITELTHVHSSICDKKCYERVSEAQMAEAAQLSQDAQAGYDCDYQNKRSARSCNEVKEHVKGHQRVSEDTAGRRPAYIGKRHVTRLCSDAYGKGIVRSNQESTNLRVYARYHHVSDAEPIHTAQTGCMPGRDLTSWREAIFAQIDQVKVLQATSVDRRNPARNTAVLKNDAFMYGHRPQHPDMVLVTV